ncbi:hypothetical protein [Flavobacterium tyrosinilyticum]|uniref:hypothetical protein n=1 Tax=Flavobacterium tyrosinilyticum TaxID=1658740 RepID=UPI00202F55D4|nr:hypothetical protein [Flavobacterium tyrosinilyticum]MCM0667029.1 hypothetical protein [Flavobacterium tyrosinilyticum]
MEIRKFSNLIFSLLGTFIIYSLLFKYTIGAVFGINKLSVYQEFPNRFSFNLNIAFIIILCFVVLIKNSNILTYFFYQKNYIVELNELNQYRILKVIFVNFSLFRLTILFFTFHENSFWDKLTSILSIIFFFLIIFHKTIIKSIIRKINSYSKIQSDYIFIFSMIPILLYFYFFWDYGFGTGAFDLFEFIFRPIILLITLSSPLFFRLLVPKDTLITSYHFTFILFFWILFLYNLQEFLLKFPNYERDNMYLIKDLTFHVVMPLFLLSLHSFFAKIKNISTMQFAFFIVGILLIFCPIVRYINGTSYAMSLYLISGALVLFLSKKTAFLDRRLEKLKIETKKRDLKLSLKNSSSFLCIAILFITISKHFIVLFNYKPGFTALISLASVIAQLLIIGNIVLKKKLKLDDVDGYINTILTFFLILIFCNNYLWVLNNLLFNSPFLFTTDIAYFIVLILAILFSSYLTKLIKVILPKNHFRNFSN